MLEIPESKTISMQVQATLIGKKVESALAGYSPHKFAWYYGEPGLYNERLSGKTVITSKPQGGMVEIEFSDCMLVLGDGVNIRYLNPDVEPAKKHQLLIRFTDGSHLMGFLQMYGGLYCWPKEKDFDYSYYRFAKEKPSPLSPEFNQAYFTQILGGEDVKNLPLKAALATQQRIPGFGNGVLQDTLWHARLHPRRKVNTLTYEELDTLFMSVKDTLAEMTRLGGRSTEKDLFGAPGGYHVVMSAENNGKTCPECGGIITKEAFLGGSIYTCSGCQKL